MTQAEVARNTGTDGFIPITEGLSTTPDHRKIYARHAINEDGEVVAVSKGRETICMVLPESVLDEI